MSDLHSIFHSEADDILIPLESNHAKPTSFYTFELNLTQVTVLAYRTKNLSFHFEDEILEMKVDCAGDQYVTFIDSLAPLS